MKLIANWLNSFDYSKEELAKLTSIRDSEQIVEDNFEEEKIELCLCFHSIALRIKNYQWMRVLQTL